MHFLIYNKQRTLFKYRIRNDRKIIARGQDYPVSFGKNCKRRMKIFAIDIEQMDIEQEQQAGQNQAHRK